MPLIEHSNGYTVTEFQNRFITWHRTFTRDHNPPLLASSSLVHIHEWIPAIEPSSTIMKTLKKQGKNFFKFSTKYFEAVTVLTQNFTKDWSAKTRYHLSTTKKNPNLHLRLGTFDELATIMYSSQVPKYMHRFQLALAKTHLEKHPEDIEILVATIKNIPVACFVAGYCTDAQESSYLVGCFTKDERKSRVMLALVHWWFERCLERGMVHANFGNIVGPHPFPFHSMIGFSNFKTHFNIHRVWMPGSRWRVTLSLQFLHDFLFKVNKI